MHNPDGNSPEQFSFHYASQLYRQDIMKIIATADCLRIISFGNADFSKQ